MTIALRRTSNTDPQFAAMTRQLDADLWARYGDVQGQYAPLNVMQVDTAIVAVVDGAPVGCGCFKAHAPGTVELKRVFVTPAQRGRGVARAIVLALETWARELGNTTAVLETGTLQHEAIAMYERLGYARIEPFPPYDTMPASICMRKSLVCSTVPA